MWIQFVKPSAVTKFCLETKDLLRARATPGGQTEVQKPVLFHMSADNEFTFAELETIFATAPKGDDPSMAVYEVEPGYHVSEFFVWRKHNSSAKQLDAAQTALSHAAV